MSCVGAPHGRATRKLCHSSLLQHGPLELVRLLLVLLAHIRGISNAPKFQSIGI